jgi:hypothetical protein
MMFWMHGCEGCDNVDFLWDFFCVPLILNFVIQFFATIIFCMLQHELSFILLFVDIFTLILRQ